MTLSKRITDMLQKHQFGYKNVRKEEKAYFVDLVQYTPLGHEWTVTIWYDGTEEDFINETIRLLADAYWQKGTLAQLAYDLQTM